MGMALVSRREAARLLGRSTSTVDRLARRGAISRVVWPGYSRGSGYRREDVDRLLGMAAATPSWMDEIDTK